MERIITSVMLAASILQLSAQEQTDTIKVQHLNEVVVEPDAKDIRHIDFLYPDRKAEERCTERDRPAATHGNTTNQN